MILQSHPTGNAYVRQSLQGLDEAELLAEFWTCINWKPNSPLARLAPGPLRNQLARRVFPKTKAEIKTLPWREVGRLIALRAGWKKLTQHETGLCSVDAIFQGLDRHVARKIPRIPSLTGVFAQEDGALDIFKVAKKQGLVTFYDLPIAHWRLREELLLEEAERWPEWKPTLVGTHDSKAKLDRKTEELALADVIFVPSQFVRDSLPPAEMHGKECHVVEFGSPQIPVEFQERVSSDGEKNRPLRVLFAGSLTQRKGLADVFAAMRLLKRDDVELVVMGSPIAPLEFYKGQFPGMRYEPTRPHREVLKLMRECDVFILPSIAEGRALVQQEAMMCGLPLIVTPNAGGEDLIEEGNTGFLVPIRSPERLAEKINWFADHREELPRMRLAAQQKAAEYTWESYRTRIADAVATRIKSA